MQLETFSSQQCEKEEVALEEFQFQVSISSCL